MSKRLSYEDSGYVHFISFTCFGRRAFLDTEYARNIVVSVLETRLRRTETICHGFVVMPEHVHAVLEFTQAKALSNFLQQWKRLSSHAIRKHIAADRPGYHEATSHADAIWQHGYHDFSLLTESKFNEKLQYMHNNPVIRGLVDEPAKWHWSSARWYEEGKSVGVPIGGRP